MRHIVFALLACVCTALPAVDFTSAPVFQYRVQAVDTGAKAYLWIPHSVTDLAGLLIAPTTDAEFTLVRHPTIRAACTRNKLAIVWFTGGLPSKTGASSLGTVLAGDLPQPNGAPGGTDVRDILRMTLKALADTSGYAEIEHAPWILFGHSTGALTARNLAYWQPDRTIALWYFKAGTLLRDHQRGVNHPGTGWQTAIGSTADLVDRLKGVPTWGINGEWEEFGPPDMPTGDNPWTIAHTDMRTELQSLRALGSPACQLVDPGAGHHALNDAMIDTFAAIIDGVVPARVPANTYADASPITLTTISASNGYLSDSMVESVTHATAPFGSYGGSAGTAWWHPDSTTAAAVDALHANIRAGQHHFLDYTTDTGTITPDDPDGTGVQYSYQRATFSPLTSGTGSLTDGSSFKTEATYRSDWPNKFDEGDLDPSDQVKGLSDATITFRTNAFSAWELTHTGTYASGARTAVFAARTDGWGVGWENLPGAAFKVHAIAPQGNHGGTDYRHHERTLEVRKYKPSGSSQTVDATMTLNDRTADAADQLLTTTFTSGLPPVHYVAYGPATVIRDVDGKEYLHIQEIPAKATFPIAVRVTAYQWGRASGSKIDSAEHHYDFTITGNGAATPVDVTITDTSATYDGAAHGISVTTNPPGVGYSITYDGSAPEPTDAGSYAVIVTITEAGYSGTANDTLAIAPATPTITWGQPGTILTTTPLGNDQLDATSDTTGTFTYTPPAGTVLTPGSHTLSVDFTPDSNNYTAVTGATVTLTVVDRWDGRYINLQWQRSGTPVEVQVGADQAGNPVYDATADDHDIGPLADDQDVIVTAFEPTGG